MVNPNKMIRRRNESHHPLPSVLESWNISSLGLPEDRPNDHYAFPNVLSSCLELVLHMAYVALSSTYIVLWINFRSEFNNYNGAIFDIQACSLNNLVYWLTQIVGSLFMGIILDQKKFNRWKHAFSGWSLLFAMVWAVHILVYLYQRFVLTFYILILVKVPFFLRDYTRASLPADSPKLNIHSHGYVAKIWLYIFCSLLGAMWQITAYWIMGAMSNDPAKLAHFTGLCEWNGCAFIRAIDTRIR